MIYYNYDPLTRIYTGMSEVESKHSTTVKPFSRQHRERYFFNGIEWRPIALGPVDFDLLVNIIVNENSEESIEYDGAERSSFVYQYAEAKEFLETGKEGVYLKAATIAGEDATELANKIVKKHEEQIITAALARKRRKEIEANLNRMTDTQLLIVYSDPYFYSTMVSIMEENSDV